MVVLVARQQVSRRTAPQCPRFLNSLYANSQCQSHVKQRQYLTIPFEPWAVGHLCPPRRRHPKRCPPRKWRSRQELQLPRAPPLPSRPASQQKQHMPKTHNNLRPAQLTRGAKWIVPRCKARKLKPAQWLAPKPRTRQQMTMPLTRPALA